jgi:hypothetical protein
MAIGVVAIITTFCDMKWWHKSIWLFLIFVLALLEAQSINKGRTEAKNRETDLYDLAQNTADTAMQTLNGVGILIRHVDDIDVKLQKAREKNDPKEIARLQAEKDAAQKQLLLALTPPTRVPNKFSDLSDSQLIQKVAKLTSSLRTRWETAII